MDIGIEYNSTYMLKSENKNLDEMYPCVLAAADTVQYFWGCLDLKRALFEKTILKKLVLFGYNFNALIIVLHKCSSLKQ